ncbi:hypothetical protein AB0M12_29310 [Nocardia vinacea]|uniref:hypothetical protein n=1 Tax=Nocardia vinacea TaxID=96468 RepID=UPI003432BA77
MSYIDDQYLDASQRKQADACFNSFLDKYDEFHSLRREVDGAEKARILFFGGLDDPVETRLGIIDFRTFLSNHPSSNPTTENDEGLQPAIGSADSALDDENSSS